MAMALPPHLQAQSAVGSIPARGSLDMPTNSILVLPKVTGEVRVLDSKGLVLEANQVYLPRIQLSDLTTAQLQALLETKTAYVTLTDFDSLHGTNGQGADLEIQIQKIWRQGKSLPDKIQTRLQILEDLHEYNINIAMLPASLAAASQYEVHANAVNDRMTNRVANVAVAAAQVEVSEQARAAGTPDAGEAVRQARDTYQDTANRFDRANDRAMIANGQAVGAEQQVEVYMAKCAAISARLANEGIYVPATPPFSPVPPLTMSSEVDAERMTNEPPGQVSN